ncbi:MAG: 30S ribosomal protein S6 [Deltaproteobacteria bacterium]|nr:30S ribosomal protein S6 [Deltaproteobacteria bacterium]
MERRYETVFIVNPEIGEEAAKGIVKKAVAAVEKHQGKDVSVDEWGRKRLSYPIQRKREGYYVLIRYTSSAEATGELERLLRYTEDVMRYQTVAIKERTAAKEAPKGPAEPQPSQSKGA